MRLPGVVAAIVGLGSLALQPSLVGAQGETKIHEAGRCAIRGQCGKTSFFGGNLPCPDNGLARLPDDSVRQKLVNLCGPKWQEGPVCCLDEQIDALSSNLKLAEGIIASCPACRENFFNTFCTFTCSPDQSLFVNVTQTDKSSSGKTVVTELDNIWSEVSQGGFFDSCKDVKNGASGGKAIDFIGGGAKNYQQFMKFLGDKKLLGSPFQINYLTEPRGPDTEGMEAVSIKPKACNDADPTYRCSCVDCPSVCPELPAVSTHEACHVGLLPCLSFAVIIVYSAFLLLVMGLASYVTYKERRFRKPERVRLLQDPSPSDDEDEGEVVHRGGYMEQPQGVYKPNTWLSAMFYRIGGTCARFPGITIGSSIIVVLLLSLGWLRFTVETDPVRLWVSPSSAAAQEKTFFDENFGPFYRAEQAFLVNETGPVLSYETLSWWFDVESRVSRLFSLEQGLLLDDVCFKPTGDACVVQSLTGYFGGSASNLDPDTWEDRIVHCTESPGDVSCLPDFKQPLRPEMIIGGYNESGNVLDAHALVATWVVNNFAQGTEGEIRAIDWEHMFESIFNVVQEEATERGLRVSFTAEVSLEQELNKSTNTDAKIVVISYIIMFIYASLALGSVTVTWKSLLTNPANALVQSKFTLGIAGIVIVLMSVSASVGLFSAAGVKVTLIIAEVIPFLVLAVGVDNIFLIVHEFERVNFSHPDDEIDERVARAVGRIGPSIFLSALTETVAFGLGAFVGMPAVKNFAAYAAGAVFINAILQVTMFISVLALNQQRVQSLRADCFPCFTVRKANSNGVSEDQIYDDQEAESALQTFIRRVYAPFILDRRVKAAVVIIFLGLLTAGLALIPKVPLGLDQRIALPSDSYLIDYFNDLDAYFRTGPPVYFVTRNVNVTERNHQQQLCGRFTTCEEYSLPFVLEQESKRPNVSYISGSAASWIDDFFYWLNPQQDCCKEDGKLCFEDRMPAWNLSLYGMPTGPEFIHYAEKWIDSPTDASCPLGGKAPYSSAVVIDEEHTMINASHFRTSHVPLRSQDDFIQAYVAARRIADGLSQEHHIDIFPYSKFYIFFDQYVSIVQLTGTLLGSAVAIIFVLTSAILGSVATGAVITTTVVMTVVDIIGTMAIAGVSLNAVSLVNLVICVGIGVEFCAHIARAFMFPSRTLLEKAPVKFRGKDARAWTALVNVGGSVFSGITITKLLGVCVLAFTRSKIFEIYYFRVWLALVVFAATHALIFLPVALSYFGGGGYFDPASDGGLEANLASRGYRSSLVYDEYDDYHSDEY
ncbi:Patched [Penicillium tannophilum]|nr:Patched [Penicillium tannophilum]